MGDDDLREREHATMEAFYRDAGHHAPGGGAFEAHGVVAAIVPGLPERSIFNSVVFRDAAGLKSALPAVTQAYADAGVLAWAVWVRDSDEEAAALLEEAGHALDSRPRSMGVSLDGFDSGAPDDLDWEASTDYGAITNIGKRGFGMPDAAEDVAPLVAGWGEVGTFYVARHDGEPAACVLTVPASLDCGVFMVATVPEARGRGLSTGLMREALNTAREQGCTSTTLQASAMGAPVYLRLGYHDLGEWGMWERRSTGDSWQP
jgi:GNAT superfamily N-acetyltransferase